MPDFITLPCLYCSVPLQIPHNTQQFACSSCGKEQIVLRAGGIVTLQPVKSSSYSRPNSIQSATQDQAKKDAQMAMWQIQDDISAMEKEVFVTKRNYRLAIKMPVNIIWFGIFALMLATIYNEILPIALVLLAIGLGWGVYTSITWEKRIARMKQALEEKKAGKNELYYRTLK